MSDEPLDWLTPERKAQLIEGRAIHVPLSVEDCKRVIPGERHELIRNQLWVTVLGVGRDQRKRFLRLRVRDDRPRLLRRTPPRVVHVGGEDVTREVEEAAAEESGYTSVGPDVLDAGEAVPAEFQRKLSTTAKGAHALDPDRAEELARRQAKAIARRTQAALIHRARSGIPADSPAMLRLAEAVDEVEREAGLAEAA